MDDDDQLSPLDRCDRCSAQAWAVTHLAHGPLYWCGHHFRSHIAAVTLAGARIHDRTDLLALTHGPNRPTVEAHA